MKNLRKVRNLNVIKENNAEFLAGEGDEEVMLTPPARKDASRAASEITASGAVSSQDSIGPIGLIRHSNA